MRFIENNKLNLNKCNKLLSASVCDIVDYVTKNFLNNGDIEAQVRTALKRLCCQG